MATPPDPIDLMSALEINRNTPKSVMDSINDAQSMSVLYGVAPEDYLGADRMLGDFDPEFSAHHLPSRGPVHQDGMFQGLPVASNTSEFYDTFTIYENESGAFFDRRDKGYTYGDRDVIYHPDDLENSEEAVPAQITYLPTSSINPSRPRTVAAGYDSARRVITVVFRDGTFYNYYLAGLGGAAANRHWQTFKTARSKGQYILVHLDSMPRGPASVEHLPSGAREALYRAARTGQILRGGYTGKQKVGSTRGTKAKGKEYGSVTGGVEGPRGGKSLKGGSGRSRNKKYS
jgi:hypothetical protein